MNNDNEIIKAASLVIEKSKFTGLKGQLSVFVEKSAFLPT